MPAVDAKIILEYAECSRARTSLGVLDKALWAAGGGWPVSKLHDWFLPN